MEGRVGVTRDLTKRGASRQLLIVKGNRREA